MSSLLKLPGPIDIHVHFREPVDTHKEDYISGTKAALAGGITVVFEMPTKGYHVLTIQELMERINLLGKKGYCDFGVYFGSDGNNIHLFEKAAELAIGLKVFLTSSTGHTVTSEASVSDIFAKWPKRKALVVHTEKSFLDKVLFYTEKLDRACHITHVPNRLMLDKIIKAKKKCHFLTCDTTPNYLFLNKKHLLKMKGFVEVMPPLEDEGENEYLLANLDKFDCLATDHAPHSISEKESDNPPTGIPGVETFIPLLLDLASKNKITIGEIIRLTNEGPKNIFRFRQRKDTFIIIDPAENYRIDGSSLFSKSGYSPYDGWELRGRVKKNVIGGKILMENGIITGEMGDGKMVDMQSL